MATHVAQTHTLTSGSNYTPAAVANLLVGGWRSTGANPSGGGVTTWTLAAENTTNREAAQWYGPVTSASAHALSWTGTLGSLDEFSAGSTSTIWTLDVHGVTTSASTGTTFSGPALVPSVSSELAYYYFATSGTASAGSTSGFSYESSSFAGDQVAYDLSVGASVTPSIGCSSSSSAGCAGALYIASIPLSGAGSLVGTFTASGTGVTVLPASGTIVGTFTAAGTPKLLGSGSVLGSFLASGTEKETLPSSAAVHGTFAASGTGLPHLPASGGLVGSFGAAIAIPLPALPTPPEPLTWEQAYLEGNQWPLSKLSVFTAEGEWIVDLDFTEATVVRDETQQVRGQLSATIPSQGLPVAENPNLGDELVPVNAGDLLHPVTCNEVRAYRGWSFPDGAELLFPWGVFRMSKPDIPDTGASILITLTGLDRSSVISRQTWTAPYAIAAGTNLGTAVMDLLNDRWPAALPPLEFQFASTTITVPATVFGADISSGTNDPYADALSLVTAAGMELFFDVNGIVVMRPVPIPTTAAIVWTFTEDEDCTLVAPVGRVLDETTTYNGVLAIGNGVSGAPVAVTVWDTDPESPTYYLGPWGQTPYPLVTSLVPAPGQSTAEAIAQLTSMATAQLQLVMGAFDSTSFLAVPLPSLKEGDGIGLIKARLGIDGEYVGSRIEMPLDFSTPMTVTNRPRRQAGSEE